LAFGFLAVFLVVLDSKFKLYTFIMNVLIKEEIEKLSNK
jgi:hypothetical protein